MFPERRRESGESFNPLQHKILHLRHAIENLSIRCEQFHLSRFPLALLFLAYQIIEFSWYFLSHARRVSGTTVNSWEKYYGERLCTRFSTVVSNFPIYTFTLMRCLFAENNLFVLSVFRWAWRISTIRRQKGWCWEFYWQTFISRACTKGISGEKGWENFQNRP